MLLMFSNIDCPLSFSHETEVPENKPNEESTSQMCVHSDCWATSKTQYYKQMGPQIVDQFSQTEFIKRSGLY